MFRYVFNADIEKMYRQNLVEPSQRLYQRMLFRSSPQEMLCDYELKTVTIRVNCAPYLSIRTLLQLADDVQENFPLDSDILPNSMYVDDVLSGAHDVKLAIESQSSVGFSLRKWTSNSKSVLHNIPTFEECASS